MTGIEVSCPCCGKIIIIGMEQSDSPAAMIFEQAFEDVKLYSFNGAKLAPAGNKQWPL